MLISMLGLYTAQRDLEIGTYFMCDECRSACSQSCPFCRDSLKGVKPGDLWIYTDEHDIVDLSVIMSDNMNRLFLYFDKLPLMDPYPGSVTFD